MIDLRNYATHLPLLIKAVEKTDGDILELGMGISTMVLDMLCRDSKREVVSVETDIKWYKENLRYLSYYHEILHMNPIYPLFDKKRWSVVLIDNRPALSRKDFAKHLKDNADIILLHDAEPEINKFYRYDKIYPLFKYKYTYTKCKPYTVALSNFIDVEKLLS